MAKTNNYQLNFESHQLINKYVEWLKKKIQKSIKSLEDPKIIHCANIMYKMPRFAGTFHLTGVTPPGEACSLTYASPFFEEVSKINANFTTKEDIRKLVQFGISYSTTRAAAESLFKSWDEKKDFPQLPTLKGDKCQTPRTIEDILTGLLLAFSNLKKHTSIIAKLHSNGHLSAVVQCLLGFLPQFNEPKAALMKHSRIEVDESEVKVIGGIRWVSQDFKIKTWNDNTESANSQDRAFWLLSAIESLQWPGSTEFGVVDSLYDFLFPSEIEETSTEHSVAKLLDCYIQKLKFFLKPITFYFNVQPMDDKEKTKLADCLRIELKAEIARMADLTRNVGIWYLSQDKYLHSDNQADLIIQAILNISGPQYLSLNYANNKMLELSCDVSSHTNESSEQPDFFDMLLCSYGIYSPPDKGDNSKTNDEIIFNIPEGQLKLRYDKKHSVPDFKSGKIELCNYLHEAVKSISNSQTRKEENWYSTAFHPMYKEFDEIRQEADTERKQHEVPYIYKALHNWRGGKYLIADLGVGYGRLAKELLKRTDIKIIGYDLSEELIGLCENDLSPEEKSQIDIIPGDFLEMGRKLSGYINKVDMALMMFTTFGCYDNDDQNIEVLEMAYNLLRPGGRLIIEQFNPVKGRKQDESNGIWQYYKGNAKFLNWELHKSSNYRLETNFTKYFGHYYYYEHKADRCDFKRCDFYSLRLYTRDWFEKIAKNKLHVEFREPKGNFLGEVYIQEKSDLLIVEIVKPHSEEDKKFIKGWIDKIAEDLHVTFKQNPPVQIKELAVGKLDLDGILGDEAMEKYLKMELNDISENSELLKKVANIILEHRKEAPNGK